MRNAMIALWPDPPGMDAAGRGMATGFLMIFAAVAALFLAPVLILAAMNRGPQVAIFLAPVPPVHALLAMAG